MERLASARTPRAARVPNPLAAKLLKVSTSLPAAPRSPDPTPTFLPRPSAAWRALRDAWVAKRGGAPGLIEQATMIPETTIADVVEVANHVTAALRNDVGRVDEVTGIATWNYWRERVKFLRKFVARATDDTALYPRNENLWASELRMVAVLLSDETRNAAPGRAANDNHVAAAWPGRAADDIQVPAVRSGWDITLDPSKATFLLDPIAAHAALLAPFRRVRGPSHDRDFPALRVGDVAPIAAYVTAALRRDLPTLNALDARIIWQRWRQAVAVMRGVLAIEPPDRAYPEVSLLDSDLSLLLRGLRRALRFPGTLARDVSFPVASTRNAGPPVDRGASDEDDNEGDEDKGAVRTPTIVRVEVELISHEGVHAPTRTFPSLWAADASLDRSFTDAPPRGPVRVAFVATWSDNWVVSHFVDVTPAILANARTRAGLLRSYLYDMGRWLLESERRDGEPRGQLHRRRSWAAELLDRLDEDTRTPVKHRNRQQGMPYLGGGVPDFKPTKRAAAMFAGIDSLLSNPSATIEAIWQRFRDANGPDLTSREDPPAPLLAVRDLVALANFITTTLRRDLTSVRANDAAVIWKKWRDAALDLRVDIRDRDPNEWSTYRAFPRRVERLARDLETAKFDPGKLFETFCPWREAYFTTSEIRPDQRGGNWRKSRVEVNAWVPS